MSEKENTLENIPTLEERVAQLVNEFGAHAVKAALDRPTQSFVADTANTAFAENWKDPNFDHDQYREILTPGYGYTPDPDADEDILGPSVPARRE